MVEIDNFNNCKILAMDFETGNIENYNRSMELFSIAGKEALKLFPEKMLSGAYEEKYFDEFWKANENKHFIFHNAKFDLSVLKVRKIDILKISFDDTLIMARMLDENRRNGLKDLRVSELGKPERESWKEVDKEDLVKYLEYARLDAEDTHELYYKLKDKIKEEGLEVVYELEKQAIFPVIDMEYYGVKIDTSLIEKQKTIVKDKIEFLKTEIFNIINMEVNLNSTKQLQEVFFRVLKYPPRSYWKTKTGISTAEKVLNEIALDKNFVQASRVAVLLLEHRKYSKLLSSFISGLLTRLSSDNRIRASFNSLGTVTGRFSATNPNLQQIPRDAFENLKDENGKDILDDKGKTKPDLETHIRSLFIEEEGNDLIVADYSQIELRIAAELSRDANMLKAFKSGVDFHSSTAEFLFNKKLEDVTKEERNIGKTLNFALLYGMGPASFASSTGKTFQEADNIIKKYWRVYSGLAQFNKVIGDMAEKTGFIRTISGRKRRFFSSYERGNIRSLAFNTVVQGSSADLIKLAMIYIYRNVNHNEIKFLMQVHDELVFECIKGRSEYYVKVIKWCMEKAIKKMVCPIIVEPKICRRWSEGK